jgi:hypothetical protein
MPAIKQHKFPFLAPQARAQQCEARKKMPPPASGAERAKKKSNAHHRELPSAADLRTLSCGVRIRQTRRADGLDRPELGHICSLSNFPQYWHVAAWPGIQ